MIREPTRQQRAVLMPKACIQVRVIGNFMEGNKVVGRKGVLN
jgi:hypothetical protein